MPKIKHRVLSDHFASGTIDLVTDRVKNKWVGIFTVLIFPVVLINLMNAYFIRHQPDQWEYFNATKITSLTLPVTFVLGEPLGSRWELISTNQGYLPVQGLRVGVKVIAVEPEPEFSFCKGLIPKTQDHERLSALCTPILAQRELFTNESGMVDFRDIVAVGGVPGMWDLLVEVYNTSKGRQAGVEVLVLTPTASTRVTVRVYRNLKVQIQPVRPPPRELEYGQVMDGTDVLCETPQDFGVANCSEGYREDLMPPTARLVYTGSSRLTNLTRMVLFQVSDFSEVLMPDAVIARSRNPQRAVSVRKYSRLTNGTSFQFTQIVSSEDATAQFENIRVYAGNNQALFLAFYSCGQFVLWNENYIDEWGARVAVEIVLNPPFEQPGNSRAAQGTVWMPSAQDQPLLLGTDGYPLGDETYLSEIEIADYPLTVKENETFVVVLNAFSMRYPRSRQIPIFPEGVVIIAEAVPAFPVQDATSYKDFWKNAKQLTGSVSVPSSLGGVGVTFQDLRFTTFGATGPYKLRFYAEGFFHVQSENVIQVSSTVDLVRVLLPPSLQLKFPGCSLQYVPVVDANEDGTADFNMLTGALQQTCLPVQAFTTYTTEELPYVEAYECKDQVFELTADCVPIQGKEVVITLTAKDRAALNFRPSPNASSEEPGTVRWKEVPETFVTDVIEIGTLPVHNGKFELASLMIPHVFANHYVMSFTIGGVTSPTIVAVDVQNTSIISNAVTMCGYAPIAFIQLIDFPTTMKVVPGGTSTSWTVRALAIDILGEPAANRTLCLKLFSVDGPDYFTRMMQDYFVWKAVNTERTILDNNATRANYTFQSTMCFITNRDGIGQLDFDWTAPGVQGMRGPHAWYIESAEYQSGKIYRKLVTIYTLVHTYYGNQDKRHCLNEFGIGNKLARTGARFIDIQPIWSGDFHPTMIMPMSRFPTFVERFNGILNGERASYYGATQRRTVSIDETGDVRYRFYARLYQGGALIDDVPTSNDDLFPAGVFITLILVSAPEGFPGQPRGQTWPYHTPPQRCMFGQAEGTGECWSSNDLILTALPESLGDQGITNDDGIARFQFRTTIPGVYRVLLVAGGRQQSNELGYLLEIEVVRFRASPHCLPSAVNVPNLEPFIKNYDRCPYRNPDGSCPWHLNKFCERGGVRNALILSQPATATCLPIGAQFPSAFTVGIQSDAQELLAKFYAKMEGSDSILHTHDSDVGPTPASGSQSVLPVLDYADPGKHRVVWRVEGITNPYSAISEPSNEFVVTDFLTASFAVQPPPFLVEGEALRPVVQLVVVRECDVTSRVDMWRPPPLEIFAETFTIKQDNSNGNQIDLNETETYFPSAMEGLGNLSTPYLLVEGAVSYPILVEPGTAARAEWPSLQLMYATGGSVVFGVRVLGSSIVLARSTPVVVPRSAAYVLLLDDVGDVVSFELGINLRVVAYSGGGHVMKNCIVAANIEPVDSSRTSDAGFIAGSRNNVTAWFEPETSRRATDEHGLAYFNLQIAYFVQTDVRYRITFRGALGNSAPTSTRAFKIISSAASVEMIAQPRVWDTVQPTWVWPLLRSKTQSIGLMTYIKQAWVQETPASMKGTFIGPGRNQGENEIVLRVRDHSGRGVTGLLFNVTLVDVDNKILNSVRTASRGVSLSQDWGLQAQANKGPDFCKTSKGTLDCPGLYHFPILATDNKLKDGFYQFRFEARGWEVIQSDELLVENIFLPDTKFKEGFLLGAFCTIFIAYFIFRWNRLRRHVLNVRTGKFVLQRDKYMRVKNFLIACVVAVFAALHWIFYDFSDLDKLPPLEVDGKLTFADGFGRWSTILLLGFVVLSAIVSRDEEPWARQGQREQTMRRLGGAENVEIIRKNFAPRPAKYVRPPPNIDSQFRALRFIKVYWNKVRKRLEWMWELYPILVYKWYLVKREIRNNIPMFASLYSGISDVFFPHRLHFTLALAGFTSVVLCGIGLWLSENAQGILSRQYGEYVKIVQAFGTVKQIDWVRQVQTTRQGKLLNINEYIILFCARTAPLGTPFYLEMSAAVYGAAVVSTYATTACFVIGTLLSFATTREHITMMRRGVHHAKVQNLKLADSSAYLGVQACCAAMGWLVMFFFIFMFLFIYMWPPARFGYDDVMRATWATSIPLYFCAVVFARIAVHQYPGLMVANRSLWALIEFVMLLLNIVIGGPIAFGRLCAGIVRNVLLWSWLQNAQHPTDPLGTPGSGLYFASMYVDHLHNSPLIRVMVQRLHVELRNIANLKRFPPDNIEPIVLKKEMLEYKDSRNQRLVLARLMLLFLLKTNAQRRLADFRKHNIQPEVLQVVEDENEEPQGNAMARWRQMEKDHKEGRLGKKDTSPLGSPVNRRSSLKAGNGSPTNRRASVRLQPTLDHNS